jgi:hypothetical protein
MIWVSAMRDTYASQHKHGATVESHNEHVLRWQACFSDNYPKALEDNSLVLVTVEVQNDSQEIGPQVGILSKML